MDNFSYMKIFNLLLFKYSANVSHIKTTAQEITGYLQIFPVRITEKPYVFCVETL